MNHTNIPSYYALPGIKALGLPIGAEIIIAQVCRSYNITLEAIQSPTRKREVTFPRQLIVYLLRKRTNMKDREIAALVNRERTEVTRAVSAIQDYIDTNSLNKRNEILTHLTLLGHVA